MPDIFNRKVFLLEHVWGLLAISSCILNIQLQLENMANPLRYLSLSRPNQEKTCHQTYLSKL